MRRTLFLFLCLSFLLPLTAQDSPGRRTSLWNNDAALFADPKAKGINDIVIIRVEENTKASNKGGSKTAKSGSSSLGVDSFLGFETSLAGKITNSSFDPKDLFGHTSAKNDSGSGEVTQNTSLTGYIAAKVVDCLPNGNMVIEAKKEIMINNDKQEMVLRGMVRPRDISYDNTISSNAVADVQIMLKGKGPISEQQRRGWLSWLLSTIWPF